MSSQNFPRAPRNPRVEHVRVDRLTNGLIREAKSWNNSRVFFDLNRYVLDERERFDRPIYRERSPLRRAFETAYPRNENPYLQYFNDGDAWGQPPIQDPYVHDHARTYGAYFECEQDPLFYPTHSEFVPEDEFYEDTPRDDDGAEYEDEEGEIDHGRSWRPQSSVHFATEEPSLPVRKIATASGVPTVLEGAQATSGPSNAGQTYEVTDFSLMPSKLDAWISRWSKDKGVLKSVSAREEALVRTQLKIMDIGPPLIDLYSRLATLEEATASSLRRSVQAALQQWGRAFAHISKKRRESVVHFTDPRVDYLLKDDNCFATGKEARELLFTGRFLEKMLTEANQDETLARRDKAVAATDRRNPVRSTRRDQQIPPLTRHTHYGVPHFYRGGRPRGRR
ncbi:hypothetical protein DAPPUDRAFT_120782 [Daphnia pulex]|uniref:Uncharacterized protein n=1 Tax=Daphnia pulex TaxID=6669 RepID=E9I275_DAPPU|nr:hypothetical protein DAPPUDRAFT_120782 [Daphnia pulex]|eukprot:EFX61906.1 hypothetical protein DAPPUDRAFT_120782 [Daphnia pulex]